MRIKIDEYELEERAAIMEFDAKIERNLAEKLAYIDCKKNKILELKLGEEND